MAFGKIISIFFGLVLIFLSLVHRIPSLQGTLGGYVSFILLGIGVIIILLKPTHRSGPKRDRPILLVYLMAILVVVVSLVRLIDQLFGYTLPYRFSDPWLHTFVIFFMGLIMVLRGFHRSNEQVSI